jgi:hypothetical protein
VTLPAGAYAVGLTTFTGGVNINWFELTGPTGARMPAKSMPFRGPINVKSVIKEKAMPSFYPNPMGNTLNISETFDQPTQLQIVDFTGNIIFEKMLKEGEQEVDVNRLVPGTYLIKLSNSKIRKTERMIKE